MIGLRSGALDRNMRLATSNGDLLAGERGGEGWSVIVDPERYDDVADGLDEATMGGLALLPGQDLIASTAARGALVIPADQWNGDWMLQGGGAILGFAGSGGKALWLEPVSPVQEGTFEAKVVLPGLGDLETLCAADQPLDPARVVAATRDAVAAATASRVAMATNAAATQTAASTVLTAQAPTRVALATAEATMATTPPPVATEAAKTYATLVASCGTGDPYLAAAKLVPNFDSRGGRYPPSALEVEPSLLAFNRSVAGTKMPVLARLPQTGAVFGLAYDWRRGQLYTGAYLKPLAAFGPAGPGAIYRVDLRTGGVPLGQARGRLRPAQPCDVLR